MSRLIDVDKAENDIVENVTTKAVSRVVAILQGQPTVKAIPIDKPFLKMRYGDYVVYNKKWLVDHLQTEWNILQGKEYQPSIPVEWIDEWLDKTTNTKDGDDISMLEEGVKIGIAFIDLMVRQWEKENGEKTV